MPNIGGPELIIALIIIVVLFGGGRIAKLGGEFGGAIREFRRGLGGGENAEDKEIKKELPEQAPTNSK